MTKEEAIKVIEVIEKRFITLDKEELQALDMAIKALEDKNIKTHYFRDDYCSKERW